jgi:DNA polymerase I-like protein with 3'-5' exonuclease and polymerase domains
MSLHDAIMLYVKEEVADIWAERVIDIMRNPPLKEWFDVELKVPLDAEAKIGTHWGE